MLQTGHIFESEEGCLISKFPRKGVCKGFEWPHYYIHYKHVVDGTDSRDMKSTKTGINVDGCSYTISTG